MVLSLADSGRIKMMTVMVSCVSRGSFVQKKTVGPKNIVENDPLSLLDTENLFQKFQTGKKIFSKNSYLSISEEVVVLSQV